MARALVSQRDADRKQLIKVIHIGKAKLGMDDDTYRALLGRIGGGKTSSKDLSLLQLRGVLTELRAKGFTGKDGTTRPQVAGGRGAKAAPSDREALMGKVKTMLAAAQRDMAYADGMANHMFQVAKVEWLDKEQLRRLVVALTYDAERRARREADAAGKLPA